MSEWVRACNTHACVEVKLDVIASVAYVRDGTTLDDTELCFTRKEWEEFTDDVKRGLFDWDNLV